VPTLTRGQRHFFLGTNQSTAGALFARADRIPVHRYLQRAARGRLHSTAGCAQTLHPQGPPFPHLTHRGCVHTQHPKGCPHASCPKMCAHIASLGASITRHTPQGCAHTLHHKGLSSLPVRTHCTTKDCLLCLCAHIAPQRTVFSACVHTSHHKGLSSLPVCTHCTTKDCLCRTP